jgi:hypothetical protein
VAFCLEDKKADWFENKFLHVFFVLVVPFQVTISCAQQNLKKAAHKNVDEIDPLCV